MSPGLQDGDYVLCASLPVLRYRLGDLLVADHPYYGRLIKRIAVIDDQGRVRLKGENPDSLNEAQMGWFEPSAISGKVIWTIKAFSQRLND